jgi:hypothetical protein
MLCGYNVTKCPRRKHLDLQNTTEKVGVAGFYIATPNSKKTVLDAIEDTLVTEVDMKRHKEENRLLLEAVGGSVQKQEAEQAYKAKSPPVVQIDPMPTIMGERLPTVRCELINDWLNSLPATPRASDLMPDLDSVSVPERESKPSIPMPVQTGPPGEAPLIVDLMLQLVNWLDSMQKTQELLVDAIVSRESSMNTTNVNRATAKVNRISKSSE